jgi:predicted methyltransferase
MDDDLDLDVIVPEVAAAVGLAEGESGVRDILRVVARAEPVPASQVSRLAELPVPIVTAVCNELRKRGVIDRTRPVRLTSAAREMLAAGGPHLGSQCPECGGLGLIIPAELKPLADELEQVAAGAPQARLDLDQTHCTVDTKLRRVLKLDDSGALDGKDVILIGDDDLVSIAICRFAQLAGTGRPRSLAVVDTDPAVLSYVGEQTSDSGIPVRLVEHDLRQPLPDDLAGAFDVACTDPPYTLPGAELFLSRAVAALRPRPGSHVFFSFGARRPSETLATQRLITDLGLVTRSLTPNFNQYLGAGVLAGGSHLYHLRSTEETWPVLEGGYAGPLYTADTRPGQTRPYRCAGCGAVQVVGAVPVAGSTDGQAGRWATIADLKAAGCPACGGTTFRPQPREPRQRG